MMLSRWILCFLFSIAFCKNDHLIGNVAPGWEFVRDLFNENLVNEDDLGAAISVYHQGHPVVNLIGGWFDESKTKPYNNETLQLVFSTTKGIVAMAAAICVQRGLLNYSALVTDYWPEYGQNGKEHTTVADILSHRSGLPYVSSPVKQYLNWTAMTQILQEQAPDWVPGTAHGYHAITYGWLAGEIIRRVDPKKRSVGQFVQDELITPTKTEFYIGLPPNQQYRVSPVVPQLHSKNSLNETMLTLFDIWNDPEIHQAEIPNAIGLTNAWSIARLYSAFIGNIRDDFGHTLISDDVLQNAIKSNTPLNEIDLVLQYYSSFSMGFHRFDRVLPQLGPNVFGHHGAGGSIGFAAPAKNLSFAYVMNRIGTSTETIIDPRFEQILNQITEKINTQL